jgi:hypothetical protein
MKLMCIVSFSSPRQGCGASSTKVPLEAAWQRDARAQHTKNHSGIQRSLAEVPPGALRIGVFGLRGAGKTTMLHAIRQAIHAPSDAPRSILPLSAPSSAFALHVGSLTPGVAASSPQLCVIDTPGLPILGGADDGGWNLAALRRVLLLGGLQRVVYVIDSSDNETNLHLAAVELAELWEEVQRANLAMQRGENAEDQTGAPVKRLPTKLALPELHIVFTKQAEPSAAPSPEDASSPSACSSPFAGTPSPFALLSSLHLPVLFPSPPSPLTGSGSAGTVHGFSACWDARRIRAVAMMIFGPQGGGEQTSRAKHAAWTSHGSGAAAQAESSPPPPLLVVPQTSTSGVVAVFPPSASAGAAPVARTNAASNSAFAAWANDPPQQHQGKATARVGSSSQLPTPMHAAVSPNLLTPSHVKLMSASPSEAKLASTPAADAAAVSSS